MSDGSTTETPAEDSAASTTTAGPEGSSGAEDSAASTTTAGPEGSSGAEDSAASTTIAGPEGSSGAEDSAAEGRENPRKVREGIVVSTGMNKTVVVEAIDRVRHRRYAKTVQRSSRLFAHDEENETNVGDRVRIQETRPLSKKKRWRLVQIIERAR